ncbi:MAG: hypothetical protein Q7T50_02175 [Candidatus Magasanikbacteria bacterium]|nr:hypothetical protein [Candidatus Magasanikbacteria bacterium]
MRVEGNRVPDFLDRHGVLCIVYRKLPVMSQADFLEAGSVINPSFDQSKEPVGGVVEVVEPTNRLIDDCSREAMSESAFSRRLDGDPPIKFGSLEADHGVW